MLGELARGRGGQEPLRSTGGSDAGNGQAVSRSTNQT
jgi:hypothetical protein